MIGDELKEWMAANGWTVRSLARELDVSNSTIQAWRDGTHRIPKTAEMALAGLGRRPVIDRAHLQELISEAEANPDAAWDQPQGRYVQEAVDEFESAGFDIPHPTEGYGHPTKVPWGAVAARAWELKEENEDD